MTFSGNERKAAKTAKTTINFFTHKNTHIKMEPLKFEITVKLEATGLLGDLVKTLLQDYHSNSGSAPIPVAVPADAIEATNERPSSEAKRKKKPAAAAEAPIDTSLAKAVASGPKNLAADDEDDQDEAPVKIGLDDLKEATKYLVQRDRGREMLKAMLQKRFASDNISGLAVEDRAEALRRIENLTAKLKEEEKAAVDEDDDI